MLVVWFKVLYVQGWCCGQEQQQVAVCSVSQDVTRSTLLHPDHATYHHSVQAWGTLSEAKATAVRVVGVTSVLLPW